MFSVMMRQARVCSRMRVCFVSERVSCPFQYDFVRLVANYEGESGFGSWQLQVSVCLRILSK